MPTLAPKPSQGEEPWTERTKARLPARANSEGEEEGELGEADFGTDSQSMRASWLHRLAQHENVSMQFVPTAHQKADILTKGLTAYAHELARQGLRLQICDGL